MREREAKLTIDLDAELPPPQQLLDGIGEWSVHEIDQDAVYFDTEDLRLTRAGVSLRYRSDDGWTVKLPESRDGATFVRQEHRFDGAPGEPPRAATELVRAWARSSPLGEVAQIRTHRRKLRLFDATGRSLGEIDDDAVTAAVTSRSQTRFREIEVEMNEDADPQLVDALVRRLRKAGAGMGRSMPKITRALGAPALAPPDVLLPPPLDRASTLGDLVRATLAHSVQRLITHDPLIRLGEDPGDVHRARVATRRLRSDLRTFRPLLDRTWSEPLRDELTWLGEEIGRVRDADVLLELLASKAEDVPAARREPANELIDRLRTMRERDRDALLESMRSPRYATLLDRLVEGARDPRLERKAARKRASKAVGALARRPWKRLRKRVRRLPSAPADADLHEVRKRAKQARYALEAIAPVAGRRAARTAKRLTELQDVLGDHQDAVVACEWLYSAARDSDGTAMAFVAGELAGSWSADRHALRRRWRKAWKQAKRRNRYAWR